MSPSTAAHGPFGTRSNVISTDDELSPLEADWNRSEQNLQSSQRIHDLWLGQGMVPRRHTADQGREHMQPYGLAIRHEDCIVGIETTRAAAGVVLRISRAQARVRRGPCRLQRIVRATIRGLPNEYDRGGAPRRDAG